MYLIRRGLSKIYNVGSSSVNMQRSINMQHFVYCVSFFCFVLGALFPVSIICTLSTILFPLFQ